MNDPGLDAPIQNAEHTVHPSRGEMDEEREEEDLLLDPSRWWFASTASPLVAGTFGPMASAFNICALVTHWRMYIPVGATESAGLSIDDPNWLLVVNGISLGFAIIGNGTLLLNMVGRLRFKYAQPITIGSFYISAILLISIVAVASTDKFRLQPYARHALTQGFYYAGFAAGLYMLIGILMTFTVYGALAGKYPKKFEINPSQRTLMLQTISFMAYLLIGAAIYSRLEDWEYVDAIFWADFTLLTIGLGIPFVPKTHAGRSLIIPFTFGGILAVGLIIGSIRSMLLEKGAQKMHARSTEKRRQRVVSLRDSEVGKSRWNWLYSRKHPSRRAHTLKLPERDRRREEFLAMRHIQQHAQSMNRYRSLAISTTAAAILWFFGALVFFYAEYQQGWTYFDAMYFSYTSLVTIGYGDFQPASNSGKSFFVFWTLLAVPTLTVLISDMGDTVVKGVADATNWLGSLTITPGDEHFWRELRQTINGLSGGTMFKDQARPGGHGDRKSTHMQRGRDEVIKRFKKDEDESRLGDFSELLYSRLTKEERKAVDEFPVDEEQSQHERDTLFYHFLLVKEVRDVLADSQSGAEKTYTFDEWAYFLKLIGQDEDSQKLHTRKYNQPKKDEEHAPQVGRILDHEGNAREWSWLSLRSPLLSQQSEPEWVLQRLLEKLHGEMHFQKKKVGAPGDVREGVPVSMKSVMSKTRSGSGAGNETLTGDVEEGKHEKEEKVDADVEKQEEEEHG